MNTTKPTCERGCNAPAWCKGLCRTCYQRRRAEHMPPCGVDGCAANAHSKGMCFRHYHQQHNAARLRQRMLDAGVVSRDGRHRKQCACGSEFEVTTRNYVSRERCDDCRRKHTRQLERQNPLSRAHKRQHRHMARLHPGAPREQIAGHLARMLATATDCPLCDATMADGPGPTQKQIDHIVPLEVGGGHTRDNVRVICATCNRARQNVTSRDW